MNDGNYWLGLRRFSWGVLVLASLAVLSRFWGLGQWALDGDEIITANRGGERLWAISNPAYYWLWAISNGIMGQSAFSVRLPSAIFGALAIPVFALTWRRIIGERAALLGAAALLLCGWHVAHSQWGRYYACVFFFSSLSYYYYCRAIKDDSWRQMLASGVLGAIAASFHASAAAVPASCFIATLVMWTFGHRLGIPQIGKTLLRAHLVLAAVGICVGLPIVLTILGSWATGGLPPIGAPLMAVRFAKYAEIPTLLLAAAGWFVMLRDDRQLAVIVAVCVGVPLCLAIGAAQFIGMREDYLFFVMPLLMVAIGWFVHSVTVSLGSIARPAVSAALLGLLLPTFASHFMEKRSLDVRDAVRYVESNWIAGDQTLSFSGAFRYYAPAKLNVIQPDALRPFAMKGRGAPQGGWRSQLEPILRFSGRTWVIVRQTRDPKYAELSSWLGEHAHLVWRKNAIRLDEEMDGFEIWRVDAARGNLE